MIYSTNKQKSTHKNFEGASVPSKLYTIASLLNKYKPMVNQNGIDEILAEDGVEFLYNLADAVEEDGLTIELDRALADYNF